ncbi:hypothetical protein HMPREF3034_02041 [Prevotella sp. DNF00663]|nr:hypothetical protein HMPREF3034_02041 [Prevotella sp. DNF00663]
MVEEAIKSYVRISENLRKFSEILRHFFESLFYRGQNKSTIRQKSRQQRQTFHHSSNRGW